MLYFPAFERNFWGGCKLWHGLNMEHLPLRVYLSLPVRFIITFIIINLVQAIFFFCGQAILLRELIKNPQIF